jgi:FlaA1/EpsC-like NDP-sugar epimerase
VSKIVFVLLFVEGLVLLGAVYLGAAMRFLEVGESSATVSNLDHFFTSALAFAVALIFSMSAMGMYQLDFDEGVRHPLLMKLMPSFVMGFVILTLVFYLAPELYFGRGVLLLAFGVAAVGILTARFVVFKSSQAHLLRTRILFVGSGPLARECSDLATRSNRYHTYDIAGFVPIATEDLCVSPSRLLKGPEGGTLPDLARLAREYNVAEIVVAVLNRRGGFPIKELLDC